jgi:hypothetical protein
LPKCENDADGSVANDRAARRDRGLRNPSLRQRAIANGLIGAFSSDRLDAFDSYWTRR